MIALHWLRSPKFIDFKLAMPVYRCLYNLATRYLWLHSVVDLSLRCLQSSTSSQLVIRRTRLSTVGDRVFGGWVARTVCRTTSPPTQLQARCFPETPQYLPFPHLLARDAFARTNCRAIAMMFVRLSVGPSAWDGRAL